MAPLIDGCRSWSSVARDVARTVASRTPSCTLDISMRAASFDEIATSPAGTYLAGPTFVHFCMSETLWGVVLWGRPNADDVASLVRSLALELDAPAVRHASIVDARRLEGADLGAFGALQTYVETNGGKLANAVARLALVRPAGLAGAVVSGFFEVLSRPYPVQIFASAEPGLAWLAEHEAKGLDTQAAAAELEALVAEVSSTPAIVVGLRTYLETHLGDEFGIAHAARTLATSERTLQRRLAEAETTFVEEVALARIRVAKRLLLDSDAPLTRVALDVGCASLAHFSALFSKHMGQSPSAWRERSRWPERGA
jgi:AraC-like DNA-binding protein